MVATALSWPGVLKPNAFVDTGAIVGMHVAVAERLRAGVDWVTSYGFLGFLDFTGWYGRVTGPLSVLFEILVRVGLAFAVTQRLRAHVPAVVAAAAAFVLLFTLPIGGGELAMILFAYAATRLALRRSLSIPIVIALGVSAGLMGELKASFAITAGLAALLLVALNAQRARNITVVVLAGAVGFLGPWFALGQRAGDLLPYGKSLVWSFLGYQDVNALETNGWAWHYGVALVLALLFAWLAWDATPVDRRVRVSAVTGWLLYAQAKHGFVRHDAHSLVVFGTAVVMAAAFTEMRGIPRPTRVKPGVVATVAAAIALVPCVTIWTSLHEPLRPWTSVKDVALDVRDAVTFSQARLDKTRALTRSVYGRDAEVIGAADELGVHVDGDDAALAWAYDLRWDPLPSFHSYSTFNAQLDNLNVKRLVEGRPARILYDDAPPAVDSRFRLFDSPSTRLTIECNYTPDEARGHRVLLRRTTNRCEPPRLLQTVTARDGATIAVPDASPDSIVVARIDLPGAPLLTRVFDVVAKPMTHPSIAVNGQKYRLIAALAGGPLLLRTPPNAAFGPPVPITSLAVSNFPGKQCKVSFYELHLR